MSDSHVAAGSRPLSASVAAVVATIALMAIGITLVITASAQAAATAVLLGAAKSFVVLAGAGVTNTGPTTLNGDIGTYPTKTIKGAGSLTVTGTVHAGDAVSQGAKDDLVTAYDIAAGEKPPSPISGNLGGQTLTRGVYHSASTIGLTGTLTLDAAGDPDAVFVFQAGSSLTTASASRVRLTNGAQACNVFWQIGASATLGTGSTFRGSVLALTSITVTTGTTIEGRVLARNGAVTLDTNTITRPICSTPTPPATGTPSPSPTRTTPGSPSTSPTGSPSVPPTGTGTATPTDTGTATPTDTATSTATASGTAKPTGTATTSGRPTATETPAPTSTATAPGTVGPSSTSTATAAPTFTSTDHATVKGQTSTASASAQVRHFPSGALDTGSNTDGTGNGARWAGLGALVVAGVATVIGANALRARRH